MAHPRASGWTGHVLNDRYRVGRKVGRGGIGTVYEALDDETGEWVAIKLLHPHLAADESYLRRFRREADAAATLRHPHIVEIKDYRGPTGDSPAFMVMEYLEGQTLRQIMRRGAAFDAERLVAVASQVLSALGAAHASGIIHRDLKPDNIFLCWPVGKSHDRVKLLDFGLAKVFDEGVLEHLTRTGHTIGTPAYIAPEQALGRGVDARTDLFALGVVMFHVLSGELPFSGPNPAAMLHAIVHEPAPSIADFCSDLPPDLVRVINRALAKEPDDRFSSADAMRMALEYVWEDSASIAESSTTLKRPGDFPPKPGKFAQQWDEELPTEVAKTQPPEEEWDEELPTTVAGGEQDDEDLPTTVAGGDAVGGEWDELPTTVAKENEAEAAVRRAANGEESTAPADERVLELVQQQAQMHQGGEPDSGGEDSDRPTEQMSPEWVDERLPGAPSLPWGEPGSDTKPDDARASASSGRAGAGSGRESSQSASGRIDPTPSVPRETLSSAERLPAAGRGARWPYVLFAVGMLTVIAAVAAVVWRAWGPPAGGDEGGPPSASSEPHSGMASGDEAHGATTETGGTGAGQDASQVMRFGMERERDAAGQQAPAVDGGGADSGAGDAGLDAAGLVAGDAGVGRDAGTDAGAPDAGRADAGAPLVELPEVPGRIARMGDGRRSRASARLRNRAYRAMRRGGHAYAEKLLRKALQYEPQSAAAARGLARILKQRGDLEQASGWARRATRLAPGRGQGYVLLGDILNEQGDAAGARSAWNEALEVGVRRPWKVRKRLRRVR
jgi:serine/threonine-protein kinase